MCRDGLKVSEQMMKEDIKNFVQFFKNSTDTTNAAQKDADHATRE